MKPSRHPSPSGLMERIVPPLALFAAVLVAWECSTAAFQIEPLLLPPPTKVLSVSIREFAVLADATWNTSAAALCGFGLSLVSGTLIAFVFSQSRMIRSSCYPYAIFLQTVPMIAIAPLIIAWIGYGFPAIVVISLIISLFPVITNATTGMLAVDPNSLDLFQLYNASRLQTLLRLRLPHSVPYIITAAKTSSGLAVIGAIVGEFFAGDFSSSRGLGYLIRLKHEQMKTGGLFASIIASTLLGMFIFASVSLIGTAILARWYDVAEDT